MINGRQMPLETALEEDDRVAYSSGCRWRLMSCVKPGMRPLSTWKLRAIRKAFPPFRARGNRQSCAKIRPEPQRCHARASGPRYFWPGKILPQCWHSSARENAAAAGNARCSWPAAAGLAARLRICWPEQGSECSGYAIRMSLRKPISTGNCSAPKNAWPAHGFRRRCRSAGHCFPSHCRGSGNSGHGRQFARAAAGYGCGH